MPRRHQPDATTARRSFWRRPQTIGGVLYFVVLLVALAALALSLNKWREGVIVIGCLLLLGTVARLLLGEYEAGMLRVRRKWFDVLAMSGVGILLILLATTIPNQPPS